MVERPPDRFGRRRSSVRTARGVAGEWVDWKRRRAAAEASRQSRLRAGTEQMPRDARPAITSPGETVTEVTERLWLEAPDRVRVKRIDTADPTSTGATVGTEAGVATWFAMSDGPRRSWRSYQPDPPNSIDMQRHFQPLPHPMANALLYPGRAFNGLIETGLRRSVTSVLARPATDIELVRQIPSTDPESGGSDDLPWFVIQDADRVWLREDDATGAIVEIRAMFDGEVFHCDFWDELELDVPLPAELFDLDVKPEITPTLQPSGFELFAQRQGPLPDRPPVVMLEDIDNPAIRQTGLLVGQQWDINGERILQRAEPGHPVPPVTGPFGARVRLRLATDTMPASSMVARYDAGRHYVAPMLHILPPYVGADFPIAGSFGDQDGIVADVMLPVVSSPMYLLIHAFRQTNHLSSDSPDIIDEQRMGSWSFAINRR